MGNSSQMIPCLKLLLNNRRYRTLNINQYLLVHLTIKKLKNPSFPFLPTKFCKSRAETNLGGEHFLLHFKLNESFFVSAFHFNLDYPDGIFLSRNESFHIFYDRLFCVYSTRDSNANSMSIQRYFLNCP